MAKKKDQSLPKEFNNPMRITVNDGSELERFRCPRCSSNIFDKHVRRCPTCQQRVVFPWEREWKLLDYNDCNDLEDMIHKMDVTPAPEMAFDVNEQMNIYSWLLELRDYRKIGSLAQLM